MSIKNPSPSQGASYFAPRDIGTLHTTEVETLWGFGSATELSWYGLRTSTETELKPTIILFHGSGRDGRSMLDMWDELAKQENIILIAPNASASGWSLKTYDSGNVEAILKDAQKTYNIDPEQVYLFGHSGGAKLVQTLANRGNGPWRAVGSHAGTIDHTDVKDPSFSNKPIFIFNGDKDENYPVWYVEKSAKALASAGHDVSVTIIESHGHWYYDLGPKLAPIVWDELFNAASK